MFWASQGVRSAARKGSNVVVHSGHNGAGGSTTANTTTRSLHLYNPARHTQTVLHAPHPPSGPTLAQIRPRNPAHQLFSSSKNLLQRFFTHLTAPGLRLPAYLSEAQGIHHASSLHRTTLQKGFSSHARNALRDNALHRHASTFLPRGPMRPPPRCGGVAEVGLGVARNFSTARPIFQHLAENVPIAARALYEVDWDVQTKKDTERLRFMNLHVKQQTKQAKSMLKPTRKDTKLTENSQSQDVKEELTKADLDQYFASAAAAPVTTYLLIPLAPTPTGRIPLPLDETFSGEPRLLPPLSYVTAIHGSHSTHALRVHTIFTRLDQAHVWERGVQCSAYSQGHSHPHPLNIVKDDESDVGEGTCTVLKVEFAGWTKAEVRSVLGESGTGWCVLEEVRHDEDSLSDIGSTSSLSSELSEAQLGFGQTPEHPNPGSSVIPGVAVDPAQSLVIPTLDFSADFLSSSMSSPYSSRSASPNTFADFADAESDPWQDVGSHPYSSSSGSSSYSDLSDLVVDPPSVNGWFGSNTTVVPQFGFSSQFEDRRSRSEAESQEGMFY